MRRFLLLLLGLTPCLWAAAPPSLSRQETEARYQLHWGKAKKLLEKLDEPGRRQAIDHLERAVWLCRRLHGDRDEALANLLYLLARLHEVADDWAGAVSWQQALLECQQRRLDPAARDVQVARISLDVAQRLAGLDPASQRHWNEAEKLESQAEELLGKGQVDLALARAGQALALRRQLVGQKHYFLVKSLTLLARGHERRGDRHKADQALVEASEASKAGLGPDNPELVGLLLSRARLAAASRRHADADRHAGRAAELIIQHRMYVQTPLCLELAALARQCRIAGAYAEAKVGFERALDLYLRAGQEKSVACAGCRTEFAAMHITLGNYPAAEEHLRLALPVIEALPPGKDSHRALGIVLTYQGRLFRALQDLPRAEATLLRARGLLREHPALEATLLQELGLLYRQQGKLIEAVDVLTQALRMTEKTGGKEQFNYVMAVLNLGVLAVDAGLLDRAEALLGECETLAEKVLGEQHPLRVQISVARAGVAMRRGRYDAARTLFLAALDRTEQLLGKDFVGTYDIQERLARLDIHTQQFDDAARRLQSALSAAWPQLRRTALVQSERQQLAFNRSMRHLLDHYLSLPHLPPGRAYSEVLRWKGAVFLRQRRLRRLAATDPHAARLVDRLRQVGQQLTDHGSRLPQRREAVPGWKQRWQALTDERERLEKELSGLPGMSGADTPPQPQQVQAALPVGSVLVDLLEYDRTEPGVVAARQLAAFLVPARTGAIVRIDLGPAAPLAELVGRWRGALAGKGDPAAPAAELRRLLWGRIEPALGEARAVFVCPDGVLSRLPFAALPGRTPGRFLLEERAVVVAPVARLLPELLGKDEGAGQESMLLVGGVDFGEGALARLPPNPSRAWGATFSPLPATDEEVNAVRTSFAGAHPEAPIELLRGPGATAERFLRDGPGRRYLHLATHGFFAPPRVASGAGAREGTSAFHLFGAQEGVEVWHPSLLSGLALAGANRGGGVVTALQVANLDLSGTRLVVLSACETGLGEVAAGEGVLGLQRAFHLAGARTVVASLWQVDDETTRRLMLAFYDNLWRKKMGRSEALRQAQLSLLHSQGSTGPTRGLGEVTQAAASGRTHPALWAGWVLSGDPELAVQAEAEPPGPPTAQPGPPWRVIAAGLIVLLVVGGIGWRRWQRG